MVGARPWVQDGHAIVQAAFALELSSKLPPSDIRELIALHTKLQESYPRRRETAGRRIGIGGNIESGEITGQMGDLELTGFTFDSLKPNGEVLRAIGLNNNQFSVARADYESWDQTWGKEVREIFSLMLPILVKRADVISIHLQYHDRFLWEGASDAFTPGEVFREESAYLPVNAFESLDLWHNYHGFFEYPSKPAKHQLLNVIEAQVTLSDGQGALPPEGTLMAEIKISHRVTPGTEKAGGPAVPLKSIGEILGEQDGESSLLDDYMNQMHDRNKSLLAGLINDQMCEKINLKKPGE